MKAAERVLLPARFIITLGHLVATVLVYGTKANNVYAGLGLDPNDKQISAATANVKSALGFSVACFFLHFASLGFGLSLFNTKVNNNVEGCKSDACSLTYCNLLLCSRADQRLADPGALCWRCPGGTACC
jgi:Transmembrane protein